MVNGAYQSSRGSQLFAADKIKTVEEGTLHRHYNVAGLDSEFEAFREDPTSVPSLLEPSSMPWLEVSELAPELLIK
jgi:hypothetical protein